MLKIRLTEESIAERYTEWKIRCPTHLCSGQEGVAAAVGVALRNDDFAVSTHRSHGHYLGKGGDINRMFAEIYGKRTGCSGGKGGSMHLIDKSVGFMGSTAIVGGTIPLGVGLGLSIKLHATDQISCVFLGDGAIEEGVFYESVNFAVLKKLPVLFVCENNLFSVYSPLSVRQPTNRSICKMVEGIGCKAQNGNGNDVCEVYQAVHQSVEQMRSGSGPQFFEFSTYRWREHCGPFFDNDLGYRSENEFKHWKDHDPIPLMQKRLLKNEVISMAQFLELEDRLKKQIKSAFEFAENSDFPPPGDTFTQIFTDEDILR